MPWHGLGARDWRHTDKRPEAQRSGGSSGDIVMDVACDVEAGLSIRQVADRRHLPVDFIVMAISRAQECGLLQVADLTSRSACGETTCQSDPSSLICAGCLFRPRADA